MHVYFALALITLVLFSCTKASSDGLTLKLKPRVVNASVLQPATASRSIFGPHDAHLGIVRAWTTIIEVGFPPRKVEVSVDTGSSDVIVDYDSYNPSKSLTSHNLHKDWASFGSGRVYADEIKLGDVKIKDVAVGHQRKGDDYYYGDHIHGLIGIMLPRTSFGTDKPTIVKAAMEQHAFKRNVWQLTFRDDGDSSLNIGKIDKSEYEGDLGWVDIDKDQDEWRLELDINGYKAFGLVDSGGSDQLQAGTDRVQKLFHQLPITSLNRDDIRGTLDGWFDCDNIPDITITVGGRELKFPKRFMSQKKPDDDTKCKFPVYGEDDLNEWNFANPIFRIASVVFDMDNRRVGFAPQRNK